MSTRALSLIAAAAIGFIITVAGMDHYAAKQKEQRVSVHFDFGNLTNVLIHVEGTNNDYYVYVESVTHNRGMTNE